MIGLQTYLSTVQHLEMLIKHPETLIDKTSIKHLDQIESQLQWTKEAHIFHVDEDVTKLLTLTKNKPQFMHLPFNNLFIDCKITFGRLQIEGIHLLACKPLEGTKFAVIDDGDYNNFHFFYFIKDQNRPDAKYFEYGLIETTDELEVRFKEDIKKRSDEEEIDFSEAMDTSKNVKIFITNFLSLLDNPEVEIVGRKANEEKNIKRASHGKQTIPTRNFVVVKGTIKAYIEQLKTGKHFSYGHSFWVRGHFRKLEDEHYKAARGKILWVMPFIKGSGLLIEKTRIVEK